MPPDENEIFPSASRTEAENGDDSIVLEFVSFREFIERYSTKISDEGVFIVSDEPREVGDSVSFEVRLSDDFRLVQGKGTVMWRVLPGTAGREPGMAVRFQEVDEASRRLITRLVNNHRSEGGVPLDLRPPPEVAAASTPDAPDTQGVDEVFSSDSQAGVAAAHDEAAPEAPPEADARGSAEELFAEAPFRVPAGPETIALPRQPAATPGGVDLSELIETQSGGAPEHPIGPLEPHEPVPPAAGDARMPEPRDEPELETAEPRADFQEQMVEEPDEGFGHAPAAEPSELPEIATPAPGPGPWAPPDASPDAAIAPEPAPPPSLGTAFPVSGDAREIPLAPPEAILEPPGGGPPAARPAVPPSPIAPPPVDFPAGAPSFDAPGPPTPSLEPPDISSEISQITREVTGRAPEVEMPEPDEAEDYAASYPSATSSTEGGPGARLWIGLCLVAVILGGIAAVRYQDRLRELMPWIPGGEPSAQAAADQPSLEELRARLLGDQEAADEAGPVDEGQGAEPAGEDLAPGSPQPPSSDAGGEGAASSASEASARQASAAGGDRVAPGPAEPEPTPEAPLSPPKRIPRAANRFPPGPPRAGWSRSDGPISTARPSSRSRPRGRFRGRASSGCESPRVLRAR